MAYDVEYLFSGSAVTTTLNGDISAGATALTLTSSTGWTSPSAGQRTPFTIAPNTAAEEHCYYTARSGTSLTTIVRAQDGTSAAAHDSGVTIVHGWHATGANEANAAVRNTIGKVTTAGDLIVASAANTFARLAIGTARQNLQVNSGATALTYVASLQSLMTAQGDIVQASAANTPARLAIGTARQVPAVNSGATALEYVASLQSLLTTTGDIIYASSANTPARLAASTSGYVLTSGGAGVAPSWAAAASVNRHAAEINTSETTTSASFAALATAGPVATATTGTNALVILGAKSSHSAAGNRSFMGFAVSGATTVAASEANSAVYNESANNALQGPCAVIYVTGLTAGSNVFTAQYKTDGATATFLDRTIAVFDMGS